MSRKSIQISLPAAPSAPVEPELRKDIGVDSWVSPTADATRTTTEQALSRAAADDGVTVKIHLSAQPDWAEAARIFLLPQAALWFWTFGMAQKAMNLSSLWRR
jgi:hypothetical protein